MYQHHVSHHLVSCLWKHKRLTGSANLDTISPHLKTVGSGIPGSAPRLKPANQNTDGFEHTGLYLRIFILRLKASSIEISWLISSTECSQSKTHFYKCSGSEPKMKQILWLLGAFISHRSCLSVDYSDQRPLIRDLWHPQTTCRSHVWGIAWQSNVLLHHNAASGTSDSQHARLERKKFISFFFIQLMGVSTVTQRFLKKRRKIPVRVSFS